MGTTPTPCQKAAGTGCSGLQALGPLHSQMSQAVPGCGGCGQAPVGTCSHHLPALLHTFPVSGHSVSHHTPGARCLSFARANILCPTRLCPGWKWGQTGLQKAYQGKTLLHGAECASQTSLAALQVPQPRVLQGCTSAQHFPAGMKEGIFGHKQNQSTLPSSCPKVRHHRSSPWCWVWCGHLAIRGSFGTVGMEGTATAAGNSLKHDWSLSSG